MPQYYLIGQCSLRIFWRRTHLKHVRNFDSRELFVIKRLVRITVSVDPGLLSPRLIASTDTARIAEDIASRSRLTTMAVVVVSLVVVTTGQGLAYAGELGKERFESCDAHTQLSEAHFKTPGNCCRVQFPRVAALVLDVGVVDSQN